MKIFDEVGRLLEDRWLEKQYDERAFPEIAAQALREHDLPRQTSAWDVLEWTLNERELPRQRDLQARFGDPPITVFSSSRFHIDVYFWFDGTTAIHQHGFCGAFQVLLGSSIHSWYEFECRQEINAFTQIGDMSLKVCDLLEIGDVQEIWPGKQYIHSLFHLDHPSATIVARTDRSPLYLPQFAFERPYLAIDPFFDEPNTTKKLQAVSALYRAGRENADDLVATLLERSDLQTSYLILAQVRQLLRSNEMGRVFSLNTFSERFGPLVDVVEQRHGEAGESLRSVFERYDVLDEVLLRRSYVTDAEHRFFMALLLNVEGRGRIFELIRKRFPDVDPSEKVLDWVFDLSQTRLVGPQKTNALGIVDFGEAEMYALEQMLGGIADADILQAFAMEHPDADLSSVDQAIANIRGSVLFRPLLSE